MTHPVLAGLASKDPEERRRACRAAADDPSAVVLVDALCAALGDPIPAVARAASEALARIGKDDEGARSSLRRALRSDDPRRRVGAVLAESRLEPPAMRHVPALVEALDFSFGHVRWTAARLLVEAGRLHGEVLPLLLGLAGGDERARVRRMAAFCLRDLAPDREETADALIAASRDPELHVRRAALTSMAALIDPPPEVLERLLHAVDSEADPASRRIAALSLGSVAGDPPAPEVLATLHRLRDAGPDVDLGRAAAVALQRIGTRAGAERSSPS